MGLALLQSSPHVSLHLSCAGRFGSNKMPLSSNRVSQSGSADVRDDDRFCYTVSSERTTSNSTKKDGQPYLERVFILCSGRILKTRLVARPHHVAQLPCASFLLRSGKSRSAADPPRAGPRFGNWLPDREQCANPEDLSRPWQRNPIRTAGG
jgi:hypothetical protein